MVRTALTVAHDPLDGTTTNLATGYHHDYVNTNGSYPSENIASHDVIIVRGGDNEATAFTGLDATGLSAFDTRYLLNLGTKAGGSPPTANESYYGAIDAGQILLVDSTSGRKLVMSPLTITLDGTTNEWSATAHGRGTMDGPFYVQSAGGSVPTELSGKHLWLIRTGANTGKFADSLVHARNGAAIDFTGNGSGTITLVTNEWTTHIVANASTAGNRFMCPGGHDFLIPSMSVCELMRNENNDAWIVVGCATNGEAKRTITAMLQFYPSLTIGKVTPVSGSLDNFNETGWDQYTGSHFGQGTSDLEFRSHTVVRMFVDAAGAELTGMVARPLAFLKPTDFGPVKVIVNMGPGLLTVKHQSGSSNIENRIYCPYDRDIVIPPGSAGWFWSPWPDDPDAIGQWQCLSPSDRYFPSVTTPGPIEGAELTLTNVNTTSTLNAVSGSTNYIDRGSDYSSFLRLATHSDGSVLGGIKPKAASGKVEVMAIVNVGQGPLIILDEDTGATASWRIETPGNVPYVVNTRSVLWLLWDPGTNHWKVAENPTQWRRITPAVMGAGNVDSWDPTDNTTGMSFKYAKWIRCQGNGTTTNLRSMKGVTDGEEFILMNYGSPMTITHLAAGVSDKKFALPGSVATITIPTYGSVRLIYDQGNNMYVVMP